MSDSSKDPQQQEKRYENSREGSRGGYRPGRGQGNREVGGFRIRLSDNEMRAARSLQEAFNLRSTVAVLGFALRTLAQMLEEGKIDDLIAQYKNQSSRSSNRREDGNKNNFEKSKDKPNPFARPEKPQTPPPSPSSDQVEENNDVINSVAEENTDEEKNENQTISEITQKDQEHSIES